MPAMTLKERLDIAAGVADGALAKLQSGSLDREAFRQEVRVFTLAKFFLTEEEALPMPASRRCCATPTRA